MATEATIWDELTTDAENMDFDAPEEEPATSDEGDEETPSGGEESPEVSAEAPQTSEEATVPQETPDEVEQPAPEPAKPAVEAAPAASAEPAAAPVDQEPAPDLDALRTQTVDALAQRYAITDEAEIDALRTDPETVLPKLAARVATDMFESLYHTFTREVPRIVQSFTQYNTQRSETESKFFQRWPELNKPEHQETVVRLANAWRNANPGVPLEQAIEDIGAFAMYQLRLQVAPAAAAPTPATKPVKRPHTPASPGSVISESRDQPNEFADLASAVDLL